MSWFRREPPPPPPPPKKSVLTVVLPTTLSIVFLIIIGLLGIVYNGLAADVANKVDKETLQQMIVNQKQLIENNQKALEKQQENIEKQQQILDKTLQIIIEVQTEQKLRKEEEKVTQPPVLKKPVLTPKEFKEYLQLSPKEREEFRKLHPTYESLPK